MLVPLAQKAITRKQPPKPSPANTTYIPSPTQAPTRRLKADIYLPTYDADSPPPNTKLPIVINMHGSGFCFNAHGEDAHFCALLAQSLPAVVIDVDYSHAPERPWPAPVEDMDAAIAFARKFAKIGRKYKQNGGYSVTSFESLAAGAQGDWDWDERRIAITGFSAGANLALIAASARAEMNGGVQAVAAFYPSTNLAESPWEKPQLKPDKGAAGGALSPWLRYMLYECYVHKLDRMNPAILPLYASPASFPPSVTVVICEKDALAREGRRLIQKLQDSNTYNGDAVLWEAKGQGHNWDKMTKKASEAERLRDEAYTLVVKRIRAGFARVAVGFEQEEGEIVERGVADQLDRFLYYHIPCRVGGSVKFKFEKA